MDNFTIILIAIAVTAIVWAVFYLFTSVSASSRRKLRQRLVSEGRLDSSSPTQSLRLNEKQDEVTGRLGAFRPVQVLRRRLSQTFPSTSLAKFVLISAASAIAAGSAIWMFSDNPTAAIIALIAGAYLPYWVVGRKRAAWQRRVTNQLPEALDFLCRVLRAGQSMSTGLQMMSEELQAPLAGEFRRCYDQHGLGNPLEDCLRDMAIRLESQDFSFFVTAVIIQRQSGGDMAEILNNISNMIRQRLRLQQSVKAKTAEGRFTGYIMVAFPVVMFVISYVLSPERGNVLLHTGQGHMLMGIAVGLQILGFYLIRRITTVRV